MNQRHEEWHGEAQTAREEVSKRLEALEHSLLKYQGAWGAITLVLSAIGVTIVFFKEFLMRKLGFE